jgi:ubiquitin carboxyl-terminal hydrolase 14
MCVRAYSVRRALYQLESVLRCVGLIQRSIHYIIGVIFNLQTLDVYELCCDDLQAKLRDNRTKEDKQIEEALAMKRAKLSEGSETASAEPVKEAAVAVADDAATAAAAAEMEVDDEDAEALKAAMAMSLGASAPETVFASVPGVISPGSGVPADFTGMYELHSIVTHKGRSADSGHYIGWVRQAPGSDYWWKYDDDVVTESRTDEIMKLKVR